MDLAIESEYYPFFSCYQF